MCGEKYYKSNDLSQSNLCSMPSFLSQISCILSDLNVHSEQAENENPAHKSMVSTWWFLIFIYIFFFFAKWTRNCGLLVKSIQGLPDNMVWLKQGAQTLCSHLFTPNLPQECRHRKRVSLPSIWAPVQLGALQHWLCWLGTLHGC